MFWGDLGTVALLLGMVLLWWYRSLAHRLALLTGLALVTAAVSALALINFRWQAGPSVFVAVLVLVLLMTSRRRPQVVTRG